jgi:predicted PurR-regulated permease PerM
MRKVEDQAFILLIVAVTIVFAWILEPLYGAILWSVAIAILFRPLHLRIKKAMDHRPNTAAAATVILVTSVVIVPLGLVSVALGQQAAGVYESVESRNLDFALYLRRILDALPSWTRGLLNHLGLGHPADAIHKLTDALAKGGEHIAVGALGIGLGAVDYVISLGVMLYLLFFLLRDGDKLLKHIKAAVPLRPEHKDVLLSRITLVMRATIKGGVAVAIIQGSLGGLAFWLLGIPAPLLWATIMAVLSLLPAIGAAIIWAPVAVYLLATGSIWEGLFLIGFGVFVIGLVDNLLRPFLVGKSAQLPDYVVLISTLGGIELFGLNGFVIGPLAAAMFIASWELFRKTDIVSGQAG